MTLTLPQEKKGKIVQQYQDLTEEVVTLHKGTKQINWSPCINSNCSSASTSAVSSHAAITNFKIAGNRVLQLKVREVEVKAKLDWWVQNLHLTNGKSIIPASHQLIIASDASLKG